MVSETTFDEKVEELEQWIATHDFLPEKIGKSKTINGIKQAFNVD